MPVRRVSVPFLLPLIFLNCMQGAEPSFRLDDLVVYYSLDDGSGTTAKDDSGNGFDGTLVGMDDTAWVDGKFGKALSFDGQADGKGNDRVKIPVASNVSFLGFTISLWFKTNHNFTNAGMLYFGSPNGANGFGTQQEYHINFGLSGNNLQFWGLNGLDQSTSNSFNDNVWHHVLAVNEPGNFVLYLDGGLTAKLVDTDSPGNFAFSKENQLGGSAVAERAYTGLIDDFRIYNVLLSEAEALQLYNSRAGDFNNLPVITLVGDNPLEVLKGAAFTDPGVTAADVEDGVLDPAAITVSYTMSGSTPEVLEGVTIFDASTQYQTRGPENTVNLSGLTGEEHSTNTATLWMTDAGDVNGHISFDLGDPSHLTSLHIWNHNQAGYTARGVQEFELLVDLADDGNSFTSVGNVTLAKAPGVDTYTGERIDLVALFGALPLKNVRLVKFKILSNHGDGDYSGLSEVRFTTNETIVSDTLDTSTAGLFLATYTATDSNVSSTSITRDIRVNDPDAPVIHLIGEAQMHHELDVVFEDPGLTVLDKDGQLIETTDNPVNVTGQVIATSPGIYTLEYDFTDDEGREALTVIRKVEVSDSLPPEIILVGGESIKHQLGEPFEELGYGAIDLVDGVVEVRSSQIHYNRLMHWGFDDGGSNTLLDFSRIDSLLTMTPNGQKLSGSQMLYADDNAFINAGVGIAGADQFMNLFTGYLRAKVEGLYEFGVQSEDDHGVLWLDLDQDGIFSQTGKAGNEWMNRDYAASYDGVQLTPGLYRFAAGHIEGGGNSRFEARFRAPSGGGPTGLTVINPSDPAQEGLWLVIDPLDTSVPTTHTITYTATDTAGNVATVTREIEVLDLPPKPVLTLLGRAVIKHEQYEEFIDPGVVVEDADGNSLDQNLVEVISDFDQTKSGIYTLTYTFFDQNGIPADPAVRTVIVADTLAPVLTLEGDAEMSIVKGEAFDDPGVTLQEDPEAGLVVINTALGFPQNALWAHFDASDVPGFLPGDKVEIWQDLSGNNMHLSDVRGDPMLVADAINGMPAVHVNGDDFLAVTSDIQRHYSAYVVSRLDGGRNGRLLSSRNFNWLLGYWGGFEEVFHPEGWSTLQTQSATVEPHLYAATSTGNTFVQFYADGWNQTTFEHRNGRIGKFQIGGYQVTSDPASGYVSEVLLYNNHVSTLEERLTIEVILATKYGLMGFPQYPVPNLDEVGEHTIVYAVRDQAGNLTTLTRKVTVTPNPSLPVISLAGEALLRLEVGATYTDDGATVKDADGNDLDATRIAVTGTVDPMVPGVYHVHYNFTSSEGAVADTVSRIVTVVDTLGPVITLNGDPVVQIQAGEAYVDAGATAVDVLNGATFVWSDLAVPQEGLVLHLDAASFMHLRNDGQNLTTPWEDLSPYMHHAYNRSGDPHWIEAGLNGKPVVHFDGNDWVWLTHDFRNKLPNYTVLSVARYTGGDNERVIATANTGWRFGFDQNKVRFFHANGTVYSQNGADTNWHVHIGDASDQDRANFWADGVHLANNVASLGNYDYAPGQIQLGAFQNRNTSKCEVAELLIYDRVAILCGKGSPRGSSPHQVRPQWWGHFRPSF